MRRRPSAGVPKPMGKPLHVRCSDRLGLIAVLTTAKELLVGVLAGRLQRLIEVPDQGRSVERLGQKAERTGLEGARADAFVRESRDENDRQAPPFGDQAALQLD